MPVEINIWESEFLLSTLIINDKTWLRLPSIDIVHKRDDPSNIITIHDIRCNIKGNPIELRNKVQFAYMNSFNSFSRPFKLDSLIRFTPFYPLTKPLPLKAEYFLGVYVEYIEKNNTLSSQKTESEICTLFYPEKKTKEIKMSEREGWLAIDFGTSNSTITILDPNEGIQNNELSRQQKDRFFQLFKDLLNFPSTNISSDVNDSEWNHFMKLVNTNLEQPLSDILNSDNTSSLLEVVRQIEIFLGTQSDSFRRAVTKKINEIYHEVFQVIPLQKEHLITAELDFNKSGEDKKQIISELEIIDLQEPLKVEMGSLIPDRRLGSISDLNQSEESLKLIEGKFHHSPKRYLGEEGGFSYHHPEKSPNGSQMILYKDLIKSAFNHLTLLAEKFKDQQENRLVSEEREKFTRAVVTYPTVSSPSVRSEIKQLVQGLGFKDVILDYDEASAAAIFYIWREFGGNKNIGLEAFKTRCRRRGDKWSQNLLVLDIGGGTTDLALIRLRLEQIDPFETEDYRGAGGRYYILTPDLMGSSGHLQLGGELITLRLFRTLKVAIVDFLMTAVTEKSLESAELSKLINGLDKRFRPEGTYLKYSLLQCVDREYPEEGDVIAYDLALGFAEEILHTRWKDNLKYLHTFYTLWDLAENAKKELSKGASEFDVPWKEIEFLLAREKISINNINSKFEVKITNAQLERASTSVVEEAIHIAEGLLESRLPVDECIGEKEPLDWLILSGQTCRLDLVKQKLNQIFRKAKFKWNPAKVTFVPEYAKTATSIGACYGMRLKQYRFDPQGSKRKLQNGDSELFIQVRNLLYNLPCSFKRIVNGNSETIFKPRQPLHQLESDGIAKARSEWLAVQPTITIERQDFDKQRPYFWAEFIFELLAKDKTLEVYSEMFDYCAPFKVQFEINQALEIGILLCRGIPHYIIPRDDNCLSAKKKISEYLLKHQVMELTLPEICIDGKIQWEIAVGILENSVQSVFKPGVILDKVFHYVQPDENNKPLIGAISRNPLPPFPYSGHHTFYACYPSIAESQVRIPIGQLNYNENNTNNNFQYFVTIDENGIIRIHEGKVPYWSSTEAKVLKTLEGCVFQIDTKQILTKKKDDDDDRNPFCGKH